MIQFLFILFTDYSVQIFAARHPINGFLHCKNHWYDNIIRTLQKGLAHWKVNNERVLLHEKSWQLTKHTASTRLAFYVSRLNCRQECFVIWRHGKVIKTFSVFSTVFHFMPCLHFSTLIFLDPVHWRYFSPLCWLFPTVLRVCFIFLLFQDRQGRAMSCPCEIHKKELWEYRTRFFLETIQRSQTF